MLSITGFIVGWRIENGLWNAALAYLLLLLFAYTVAWVGSWVGLHMPNPQTASTAGLIWLFPLTFLSNAFVPLAGMPPVVQTIAEWNPVSSLVLFRQPCVAAARRSMDLAGTPATTVPRRTLSRTTAPAPTTASSSTTADGRMLAPRPTCTRWPTCALPPSALLGERCA